MILHNGAIYTMHPGLPQVRALSIAGELVAGGVDVREGERDTVGHQRVDLQGRCVLPGFCDSHLHFRSWALARSELDLAGCGSLAETLRAVGAVDAGADWLRGGGWRSARWPDGEPTAAALDAVTGERPVALWAHDGHTLWLNSAALAAAGRSHPTGVLHEREAWAFPLPQPSPALAARALREAIQDANARGVVAVHDLEAVGGRGPWQRLDADGRLTLRVHMGVPVEAIGAARAIELRSGFGSRHLRVGPVKAFMDGTMGSQTAWMLDGSGDVLTTRAELEQIVLEAAGGGLNVAVHAIGDAANRAALDAFEATRETWSEALMRPRIEHAQILDDEDLPRFAELGVIASVQPTHATSDRDVADALLGERARLAYRTRELLESGALLAFGSDAPVEPLDPLSGIHAAVHRTADDREPWHPEQGIDVADAVHGFTAGGAYAVGDERHRGLLLPGHMADLVVLDTDIIAHPDRIAGARVEATMVGGRWVHNPPPW